MKRMIERTGTSTSSFIVLYCTLVYFDGCMHVRTCVKCTNMISMMIYMEYDSYHYSINTIKIIGMGRKTIKNDKKNRRNKNSMTQDYDNIRLMIRMIMIVKMIMMMIMIENKNK